MILSRTAAGLRPLYASGALLAVVALLVLTLAASCTQESANKSTSAPPAEPVTVPPVVRRAVPEATPAAQPESPSIAPLPSSEAAVVVPPGAQYVCVTSVSGQRQQTVIEFSPQVAQLCVKHPEMGPCQYERNACRRGGGRVFGADGREITTATEAEYDKKVMRVRLKSN
jgi:hypothetical protein